MAELNRRPVASLWIVENLPDASPSFNRNQRKNLARITGAYAVRIYNAEHSAFGPEAFSHFAKQTGEYEKAPASRVLYPVPVQLDDVFFCHYGRDEGHFRDDTMSVHNCINGTTPWWRKHPPLDGSYMQRMCARPGIVPQDAPM